MTYDGMLDKPQSKKITLVEIDSPIYPTWVNYSPGIWQTLLTPGIKEYTDDYGNSYYWGDKNNAYYNIQSLNVAGDLYNEVFSITDCHDTNKSWYYDKDTTILYIHLESWNPPEYFTTVAPGAAIGFTNQIDNTCNNYFEDVYYEALIESIPNMSKSKDNLFFGLIEFEGGTISFNNTGGYFDDFASRDLYGQPVRLYMSFEGLDISEREIIYTGKVEDFTFDFSTFKLVVADARKTLTRSLPVNTLSVDDYPDMDEDLEDTPIPIAFGSVTGGLAYRTSTANYIFCDTEYNDVTSGIYVYNEDGTEIPTLSTGTDGTFVVDYEGDYSASTTYAIDDIVYSEDEEGLYIAVAASTGQDVTDDDYWEELVSDSDNVYVDFTVSVTNGLDVIANLLENYQGIEYNSSNFNTAEWEEEQPDIFDVGLWLGDGEELTTIEVIEQICTDNQTIFDVMKDGRFTARSFDQYRESTYEILEDELLSDPSIDYESEEYLTSIDIDYSYDYLSEEYSNYSNTDYQDEVYGRYRTYATESFETWLTNSDDAAALSEKIMDQSKYIQPKVTLKTKMQNIGMRILDNIYYTCSRQNGNNVIPRSLYQVQSISLDMINYEMTFIIKKIREVAADIEVDHDYVYTLDTKTIVDGTIKTLPDGTIKTAITSRTGD
jgi:hypothetical protein